MLSRLPLSVLASVALAAACGGSASSTSSGGLGADGGQNDSGFTTSEHLDATAFPKTCGTGLAGTNPTGAFDAVEIRVTGHPLGEADAGAAPDYTVLDTRGSPCATASNEAACRSAFTAAIVTTSAWSTNDGYRGGVAPPPARYGFVVVTRGDTVSVLGTASDLLSFLAPVDTTTEAILVRSGPLGGTNACPRLRTDADGYSFIDEGCGPSTGSSYTTTETETKMARDGSITTTRTAGPFPDAQATCAPVP